MYLLRRKLAAGFFYICVLITSRAAEERLWIDATINRAPAKIFLDTGATEFYLFRSTAERLGLKLPDVADDSLWRMYFAKNKCRVELPGIRKRVHPVVVEPPSSVPLTDADGFVGWKMIRESVVQFDPAHQRVIFLPGTVGDLRGWTRLKAQSVKGVLALELSDERLVIVDTGQATGVGLPAELWTQWKATHPNQTIKRMKLATPSVGVVEVEESWATELQIGPIRLTNVAVQETEPWSRGLARERHAATFGLGALKRTDLIVDGKRGLAFVRPKQ